MAEKVTVTFEVETQLYEEAKEALRSLAVTPEYALQRFLEECVEKKETLIGRFKQSESAENLILETSAETLSKIVLETRDYRKILFEMKFQEKEISITNLRLHWGRELEWLDTPGNALMITRHKKRGVVMISVTTDLAITSMATDDKTIRNRSELLALI